MVKEVAESACENGEDGKKIVLESLHQKEKIKTVEKLNNFFFVNSLSVI